VVDDDDDDLQMLRLICFRLNKIGKNPNIMAQKDESDGNHDSNTISAVVNALAAEAENHNNR
jgi:hyperpolarization activated cyclic nucleotide-gated potassium channel 2